jgi:FixJ family two-component response regulator
LLAFAGRNIMGRPVRVAIVDDDEAFRRALTRLLVTLGFDVWSCSSAEELLASADALDRDCVVIDVHLPRMNGIELRRTLATLRPALPVLLLTADPVLVNRPAALEGAVCLEKTVRDGVLVKTILAMVKPVENGPALPDTTKVP